MRVLEMLENPIAKIVACLLGYFVMFAVAGGLLSHHLFLWLDVASTAAFSKTMLWMIYIVFAVLAGFVFFLVRPTFLEALGIGLLFGLAAGGAYCIGYVSMAIPLAIAVVVGAALFFFKLGPVRAADLGGGVGLTVALAMFAVSAASMAQVKTLAGVSSTSFSTVTNAQWAAMNSSQRESFLAYVAASEAKRLDIESIAVVECILPEDVIATVDDQGRVLINYAAIRVESPSVETVQKFEAQNDVEWRYESLTSAKHLVVPVCHAVGHVYEQLRVDDKLSENRNWPYEDASEPDGTNNVLDAWRESLPINPRQDVETYDSSLEEQAWGFAYTRAGTYVKSS